MRGVPGEKKHLRQRLEQTEWAQETKEGKSSWNTGVRGKVRKAGEESGQATALKAKVSNLNFI